MTRLWSALRLGDSGAERRRGQRLVLLSLTIFAWCMAYAVTQMFLDQREAAATSLTMAVLTLSWPVLLALGRPTLAAHWACTCLAVFGAYKAVGDANASSAGALLAITPLVAALLFERHEALIWLGVAALGLGLLAIAPAAPLPATDPHHLVDTAGAILVTWLLLSASDQHTRLTEGDLVDLHAALAAARREADEAHAARERLLVEMNREIRAPLNAVMGMSSHLLETPLDRAQQQYARAIYRSGRALGEVVDSVLDYDAVQRGELVLEVSPFGLRSLVGEVLQAHAPAAAAGGLLLEGVVADEVPEVLKGDAPRLRQVLMNLVGNALKFTEVGSALLRVAARGERLAFSVTDTGPGIAPEDQARLFTAFEQAAPSTARRFGGTGLGLTISQGLVRLMGGELSVDSALGAGSRFHFAVPLRAIELPEPRRLAGRRALVVDPRAACREAQLVALSRTGAAVLEAGGALDALVALRRALEIGRPIDIVLVASQLGERDAAGFADELKRDPALAGLPLVHLTEVGEEAPAEGFAASVARPFQPAALGDEVARALHVPDLRAAGLGDTITGNRRRLPLLDGPVLVVEEDPVQQVVALRSLEDMVRDVEVAGAPEQALRAVERCTPRLVLLDLHLSGADELAAALSRALPGGAVVGLAAVRSRDVEERARALGLVEVLTKPIRATTLRRLLERHLEPRAA